MISFKYIEHWIDKLAIALALLGGLGLVFATLATCLSIILKLIRRILDSTAGNFFNSESWSFIRPILGEEELVQYGVGFALFSVLPLVMMRRGHVKIDLFEPFFSKRFNLFLDFLGDLALAIIAYLIMTRQWGLIFKKTRKTQDTLSELFFQGDFSTIAERVRTTQESQILGLPLWPFYIVAEICIIIFFIVAFFCVVRSVKDLLQKTNTVGENI